MAMEQICSKAEGRFMAKSRNSVDMTQGSIERLLIMFALPLLLGQIFQQLYNAVDGVVVCPLFRFASYRSPSLW